MSGQCTHIHCPDSTHTPLTFLLLSCVIVKYTHEYNTQRTQTRHAITTQGQAITPEGQDISAPVDHGHGSQGQADQEEVAGGQEPGRIQAPGVDADVAAVSQHHQQHTRLMGQAEGCRQSRQAGSQAGMARAQRHAQEQERGHAWRRAEAASTHPATGA